MAESDRVKEARAKAAEIEEEQRRRGNHDKADNVAKTARETIQGIQRKEGN